MEMPRKETAKGEKESFRRRDSCPRVPQTFRIVLPLCATLPHLFPNFLLVSYMNETGFASPFFHFSQFGETWTGNALPSLFFPVQLVSFRGSCTPPLVKLHKKLSFSPAAGPPGAAKTAALFAKSDAFSFTLTAGCCIISCNLMRRWILCSTVPVNSESATMQIWK